MKKILLSLITSVILGCLSGYAQSANRNGLFLELRGGAVAGYVYKSEDIDMYKEYMKGGFELGLGIGYRFATSAQWAFQVKADISDNLSAKGSYMGKLFTPAVILGMRWFSNDFAGNKSAYIGLGTGFGLYPGAEYAAGYIPVEIEAGVNLTNKISVGLFALPKIQIFGELADNYWYDSSNNHSYYIYTKYSTNATLGVKLGYRF